MSQPREKEVYFTISEREEEMIKFCQNRIGIRSIDSLVMFLVHERYEMLKDIERIKKDKEVQATWGQWAANASTKPSNTPQQNIPYQNTNVPGY